jgi:hypothetical protein
MEDKVPCTCSSFEERLHCDQYRECDSLDNAAWKEVMQRRLDIAKAKLRIVEEQLERALTLLEKCRESKT